MELKDYQARVLAENQAFEAKAQASNDDVPWSSWAMRTTRRVPSSWRRTFRAW